jgi:uracil-DNA glycosylase
MGSIKDLLPRWSSFFSDNKKLIRDILCTIDSSGQRINPGREEIFSIYHMMDPEDIRVVIIGQSPYPDDNACGIPFVSKVGKVPKTLEVMRDEIYFEYDVRVGDPNGMVLSWVKEGVFIINAAPTIGINTDKEYLKDHYILWREYMVNLVSYVCRKEVPSLLLGKDAWSFEESVSSECIIKVPHPVSRSDKKFLGSGLFTSTNSYLRSKGLEEIQWCF